MQLWRCAWQNKYFISRLFLFLCCKFLPCIFQPAGQGILLSPAGLFPALCYQQAKIAFQSIMCHGLWVSDAPTVLASLIHVEPWTVIAESNPPLGLDAQIQGTASPCQWPNEVIKPLGFFANMIPSVCCASRMFVFLNNSHIKLW